MRKTIKNCLPNISAPAKLDPNFKGLVQVSVTGRKVFWTGRVAIGINYVAPRPETAWLQTQCVQRVA